MLKIGDFSKLSRISIRMLRHYDDIGLLVPRTVDPVNGYRYYGEEQLSVAGQIQNLKSMGFGLTVIGEIVSCCGSPEELEKFLRVKKKELEEEMDSIGTKLRLLDNTIDWIRKDGNMMDYQVTLKTLPERYVASVRKVIPAYDQEQILWRILNEEAGGQRLQMASPGYGMAVFHDEGYKEQGVDVEIQISVTGTYHDTEQVKFKTVPPILMASATYQGSYEQITRVNEAVAHWIHDNGYEYDGNSFCIYHVSPNDTSDPEKLVTEVCYPVKKKN